MNSRPIVMYLGGFAKVGGIETFARDFLLAIAPAYPARELIMWGERGPGFHLLSDIADSGVKISSSLWRWGCIWNLPDFLLAPIGIQAVRRAGAVIFKRPPPPGVMQILRRAGHRMGKRIPFILVTPYRPAEYWDSSSRTKLNDFDFITVQSEAGVEDLKKLGYRGRIENIPLLPPAATALVPFPVEADRNVIRLGFLGRMVAQKNLGYLLEIFQELTRSARGDLNFELHLFGDGAGRVESEQRCRELNLRGVVFHGEVSREEIPAAIDACDLFLNTSLTEGQCLAAMEVLGRGRPLVATPVGALPEMLREPALGRLAPLDHATAFSATVMEVVTAICERQITPQSVAAAFAQRYDQPAVLKRYLGLLVEAMQN